MSVWLLLAAALVVAGVVVVALVCNVYAYVSTDPKGLKCTSNPVGPDNLDWIERAAKLAKQVWCGWGNGGGVKAETVEAILRSVHPELYCLGATKEGHPPHPRGIPLTEQPRLYIQAAGDAGIVPVQSEKARRARRKAVQ